MSKNAFDIIIGANLNKFKEDIKDVQGTIGSIGEQYPIKLNLILNNKDDIIRDISDINKLASTMNTMGSSVDTKGLANKFSEAGKSGKQAGSTIKSGMEEVNREVDSLSKSLDNSIRLMKEIERTTTNALGEKSTVKTKVTGNDYNKVTEKTENGAQKSIQTEINYEKIRTEEKKIQNNIIRDTEKIQEKINRLKQDGLVSENQVNSLQNDLNELIKSRESSLSDQITYLDMVSSQYKEILESERRISFEKEKQEKMDSLNKKVDKNINADIINNVDFAEIKDKIQEISQQTTTSGLEESVKNVNELYDSIIQKQKELISEQKNAESYEKFFTQQEQKSEEFVNKQLNAMQKLRDESQNLNLTESERESVERRISEVKENMLRQQEQSVALTSNQRNALQQQLADIQNQAKVRSKANSQEEKERAKYIQQTSREADQLSRLQDRIEMKSYRASQAFKGSGAREEYRRVSEQVAKINAELEKMHSLGGQAFTDQKNKVEELVRQLDKMTIAGRTEVREREDSMFGRLGTAMRKIPVWMSAMTLFYGTLRQVKQGFQSILDIDASMTDLRKVTTGTNQELQDFLSTASDIGYELGALTSDVIDATTEFQRLGFTLQESITLGRSALIYSNVGDVSIEESTGSIISTVKGFGIEVDSAGRNVEAIIDLYNEIGNKFAVSSAGIGEALQRSAATLHQAGNSIHESVALVASANASIQDPQKVGNALKTVAMRLRGVDEDGEAILGLVPQLEEMFNSFGATIMLDENTFKSTFEIMKTLRQHWDDLADLEQANIVETMGGKSQGAIISAMIENWEDAEEAYEVGLNSAGSATEEMNQYMESMEYRINQLRVSMERFWKEFLDSDSIKGAIELLTQVMNLLTNITSSAGGFNVGAVTLGTIGVLGSKPLRDSIFQMKEYKEMMRDPEAYKIAQREIQRTSKEVMTMNQVLSKGSTAWASFGKGVKSAGRTVAHFSKGFIKITLIMTAISLTIQGLTALIKREENARKKNIERLEDEITAYERLAEAREMASYDEFMVLHERQGTLNVEELERYSTLQKQIATHMPDLISHYDEYGNAVLKTAESIRELIAEEERLHRINQRELFEEKVRESDYSEMKSLVKIARGEMQASLIQSQQLEAYNVIEDIMRREVLDADLPIDQLMQKAQELTDAFDEALGENIDEASRNQIVRHFADGIMMNMREGNAQRTYDEIVRMSEILRESADESVQNIDKAKKNLVESMRSFEAEVNEQFGFLIDENQIDVESNDFVFLNTLKNNILDNIEQFIEDGDIEGFIIEKFPEMIERAFEKMQTFDVSVNDLMNPTLNEQEIISSFQQVIDQMDDGSAEAREFVHALRLIRDQHIETSRTMKANPITFSWEENIQPHINNFINDIGDLDNAYRQLQEGQELTISQVFTLIEKYPELANNMKVVNGQIQINGKAIKDLASIKEVEFKRGLEIEKRKMKNAQETARSNIKSLLQEGRAHELLTKIKNKSVSEVMANESRVTNIRIKQLDAIGRMTGMSESQIKRERDRLIARRDEIENNLKSYKSAQTELERLESLLNFDFTANLGGITSSSSPSSKSPKSSKSSKNKDARKKELQDAMYIVDKFQKKMDKLNYKIAVQQNLQTKYSNNSSSYRKHLQEEINLTIQKRNAIDAEIKSIQRQINNRKIEQKGLIQLGNTDNKTARARNAELQQQIEEARSQMYNLRTESSSIATEINNLRFRLVESNIAIYNERRRQMEEELSYLDYSMGLYNEHSKAYENLGKAKVNSLKNVQKFHEQELGYLQTQLATNKGLTQQQKQQLEEMIDKVKISIYSANQEVLSLQQSLQSLSLAKTLKKFDSEARNYEKTISSLRDELRYEVDEGEYSKEINNLTKIMGLYKGQVRDVKENIATLEAMRRQYQGNHALVTEITQEIENWKDRLVDTENSVKDVRLELEDVYQSISDEYVELYKEQLTLLQRAEDDRYRKRMDAERKSHDQRMKHLDDELRKMEEIFDSQLDDLDREDAERTFNKELQKLQEEEQKIRSKQNELALDDSYRAKAEREKLEEDLKKTLEDIEELKYNRELDLRKQNIQDNKEAEQKKLEEKRESLQEEYDDFVESEESLKEERDRYWEDELNDERKFLKLREEVMAGSFDNMLNTVRSWTDNVKDNISELGTVITNNFTMKINDAISALNSLNRMKVGSVTNQTNPDAINKNATNDYYGLEDRDAQGVGSLQKARTVSNVNIRTGAGTSNKSLGIVPKGEDLMIKDSKNGWSKVSWRGKTGWVSEKHIAKLDKGGITPKFKGGKVAMLHEEEMIANKVQTKDILRTAQVVEGLKDILPNSNKSQSRLVESLMDNIISGLNLSDVVKSLVPNKKVESKDKTIHNEYNMPIQVEKFYGKKEDLEKLSEVVVTKMKRETGGNL